MSNTSTSDLYNEKLQKRFNDPGQVNSVEAMYRHFNKEIPRSYIESWMKKNPYQQISKPAYKSKDVTSFNVTDPSYAQIDLIYTKGLYPEDHTGVKYNYLMTCVVLLTRKVFLYPLTDKTLAESKKAVLEFKKDYPALKVIQSDNGTEFKYEKAWLQEHGLKQVKSSPYNPTSQAYVERMNSVVKNSLYKYHQKTGSTLTKELLEKTADSINDQPNRDTGVIPNNAATKENLTKLIEANQKKLDRAATSAKDDLLEVGQLVRVNLKKTNLTTQERNKFKTNKNWIPKFTVALFKIISREVSKDGFRAPTYKLKALNESDSNILKGKKFLRRDLQPVDKDTDKDFTPKVDLLKRDAANVKKKRGPYLASTVQDARADFDKNVWTPDTKNFTNRTGKNAPSKPGRQAELDKLEPKVKKAYDAFVAKHGENPKMTTLQTKNFNKLKRILGALLQVQPTEEVVVSKPITVEQIKPIKRRKMTVVSSQAS